MDCLRAAVAGVWRARPFFIDAWVVLLDHMHAIWTLPEGDCDYSGRWREIKKAFNRYLPNNEWISAPRLNRGERGIWQRRFWEHTLKNEQDYRHHLDYVHRNPLKHGLVERVKDWPYSSFHGYVKKGIYHEDWCGDGL